MAVHLVTGHAGSDHITSGDAGRLFAGIFGRGRYVLRNGSRFAATAVSANEIRIADGDLVEQGRHINIPVGTYETVAIDNGSQGKRRIDTIAVRYAKNQQGIESASIVVIKGTEVNTGTTPAYPTRTSGNILNGDTTDDFALYHVWLDGISIEKIETAFQESPSFASLVDLFYPVGSIYSSTVSDSPADRFPGTTWTRIQGRFLLGASSTYPAMQTGGEAEHELSTREMPRHKHTMDPHRHTIESHTHQASMELGGTHDHQVKVKKEGAAGTDKYVVGSGTTVAGVENDGQHRHNVSISGSGELQTEYAYNEMEYAGMGEAHNNLPPYLAVYMWRRTA